MAYCRVGEAWEHRRGLVATRAELGLRRVAGVRLIVAGGTARAEAIGVGDRLAHVIPVTLGLAAELVESGVPLLVHDQADAA